MWHLKTNKKKKKTDAAEEEKRLSRINPDQCSDMWIIMDHAAIPPVFLILFFCLAALETFVVLFGAWCKQQLFLQKKKHRSTSPSGSLPSCTISTAGLIISVWLLLSSDLAAVI